GADGGVAAIRIAGESQEPVTLTVEDLIAARREVPGVAFAMASLGRVTGHAIVAVDGAPPMPRPSESAPSGLSLQLSRITPDELPFEGRELIAGRLMTWDEYVDGSPVLVLEEQSVAELFPGRTAHDAV